MLTIFADCGGSTEVNIEGDTISIIYGCGALTDVACDTVIDMNGDTVNNV